MFLNSMIKHGVETAAPAVTGTPVALKSVDLSPLSGVGHLEGLVVGNPPGFETPYAFKLGMIHVEADITSALSDTVVVREVTIDGPEITFEGTLGGSNISKIQENVEAFMKSEESEQAQESPGMADKEGKKIIINDFVLRNAKVHLSTPLLKGEEVAIPLPSIHLRDIGKESHGASVSDVAAKILSEINSGILVAIADSGKVLGGNLKKIGESLESLKGKAQESGSEILEGVKGLFD